MRWDIKNIKSKLGYGALKEESNIINDMSGAVKVRHGYDAVVSHVITSLLIQLFIPWIDYCFNKYTEEYFHLKMSQGFDFIQDWKMNHPDRYSAIMKAIRAVRRKIDLNNEKLLIVVVKEINKRGWTVTDWEKGRFRENIATLIAEIYSP